MPGSLTSIVYRPKDAEASESGYTRVPLESAELVSGYGIAGDAKGGAGSRHLNIMAAESTESLDQEGFHAHPGQLGEQLILAGIDVDSLPAGACLQIGQSARVELTEPRTGCAKFERHQGKLRQEAAGRLGMMAQVTVSGRIKIGDAVTLVGA